MSRITISSTNILTTFSQAATRSNLTSGENLPISLGKISKFIATTPGLIVDSGTTTTYDSITYTSGTGCEIFNYSSNKVAGDYSHAEGYNTKALGTRSHTEGSSCVATGSYSHAEGQNTAAGGDSSHAEGDGTSALGNRSHTEGMDTIATGSESHAEGNSCTASNTSSHAEGQSTSANGACSHSEGSYTTANSASSHAEGYHTAASGVYSHSEGFNTTASGQASHAEGYYTTASGANSHASGFHTNAAEDNSMVIGKYNVATADRAFIIGNGSYEAEKELRSNAFSIDWEGKIYVGSNATGVDVTTLAKTSDLYTDFTYQSRNLYKWKNNWGTVIFTSDSTPTSGSDNPVTSGGVYTAIANHITIDDVYGGGTQIPSGADIDSATYRVPGVYYVASGGTGGDAPNINGLPYTGTGGRLVVTSTGSTSYVFQDYYPRTLGTNRSYRRFYNNGTWSEWGDIRSLSGFYDNGVSLEPASGTTIDLDTIGLGRFRVSSTSYASRIDNAPSDLSNKTYLIESGVTSTKGSNYYYQLIHPAGTADIIYKRVCIAGTWGEWATFRSDKCLKQLVDESDKNLVNPLKARGYSTQWSYFPITKGGITYTLNDSGSITTSGTATATTLLRIPVTLESGRDYVISGCPTGGSSSSYALQIRKAGADAYDAVVYGDSATFTASQTDYDVVIRYSNGTTAGETFTPFVCPVSKWDVSSNIVPYKQNTVEITKALVDLIDGGPKNIIENRLTSFTKNGITATTNADGSITISGKDSRTNPTSDFVLVNDLYNPSATTSFTSNIKADKTKTYICPSTGNSNIRLQALGYNSSSDYATLASSDANVTFTPVRDYIVFRIFVKAGSNFTTNQFTLYPMICEKTAWDISQKFVPYRPSYQEMYERLVALENAT